MLENTVFNIEIGRVVVVFLRAVTSHIREDEKLRVHDSTKSPVWSPASPTNLSVSS